MLQTLQEQEIAVKLVEAVDGKWVLLLLLPVIVEGLNLLFTEFEHGNLNELFFMWMEDVLKAE